MVRRRLHEAFDAVADPPEQGIQAAYRVEEPPFIGPLPLYGPKNAAYRAIKDPVRRSRKMPYKKRKYSRSRGGSRLDPGVRAVASSLNRAIKAEDRKAKIIRAAAALSGQEIAEDAYAAADSGGAVGVSYRNVDLRRQKAIAEGRGAYHIGRRIQRFGEGKFGGALKRAAISGINTAASMYGMGMYTGRGDYVENSLVGGGVAPEVPQFSSMADETGATTISRREYLTDIYGPDTAFNVQSFNLNPGLEGVFPWLSQIAQNYDEYEIKQLMFTYRSTTTDIGSSTNGQCGTVIMCTNYNAAAGPFQDKVVMMEYDGAMSCKTTESMIHGVECDPNKLSGSVGKYVRANPVISSQDLKTYDLGLFQIAIANSPSGFADAVIGELWISYTVELRKPKFFTARGLGISQDLFVSGAGSESPNFIMGTQAALLRGQQNNIGCRLVITSTFVEVIFPAGFAGNIEMLLTAENLGSTAAVNVNNTFTGNLTAINDLYGVLPQPSDAASGGFEAPSGAVTGGTQYVLCKHIAITTATGGIDNTYKFQFGNMTGGPTQTSLLIREYNSGFSYKANNIGPIGAQSNSFILVNNEGQVVQP